MVDWNPEANALFVQAIKMSSPDQRVAFLDEACAGDPALRAEVEQLLKAHEEAGNFLQRPLLGDQRTENVLGSTDGDDEPDPPEPGSGPISLDFLQPSDAPDSLGRLGQYEVREVIGRGGMGVVLKANDTKLNRIVAVKVLAPALASNATARTRFVREAQAVAAVSHHHVVTIYAVEDDPLPYLAMEFIDGQSLQEKIDRQGQLSLREILRIGQQIAAGLAAAHGHGIIHRDIKPANILLQNGIERVEITDFGLARAVDDVAITRPGEVAGTPQFMSPEQAQGQAVDSRSDLFSLGSVLYTMCTGRPPFRADTTVAILRRICDDTARPIREVNPDVPEWLVEIVERLLARQPEDRFETAAEVAELLGKHLAHVQDPGSTPFPGRLKAVRGTRADRARRRFWLGAALILLTVVGSLGLTEATGVTQLTASVIRVVTGEGTLVIEVDDPQVSITIDGEDLVITGAGPQEVRLKPGHYRVEAAKGGQLVKQELVTIQRGSRRVVSVHFQKTEIKELLPDESGGAAPAPSPPSEVAAGEPASSPPSDYEVRRYVGHTAGVDSVCLSADGKRILSGSDDRTVRLWDLETGAELRCFPGHSSFVRTVSFLRDGRRLVSGSGDGTIRIWDAGTGEELQRLTGHVREVRNVAVLSDGKRVVSASRDKTLRVWDVQSGRQVGMLELDQPALSVAALPDGRHVLWGGEAGGVLQLLDLDEASLVRRLEGHTDCVKSIAVSPDGRRALSAGGTDGTVRLWDLQTGEELRRFEGHGGWAHSAAFAPGGQLALTAGQGRMFLWDLETGQKLGTFRAPSEFTAVAFVPDDFHVVSAHWRHWKETAKDDVLRLWELPESVWPEQAVLDRLVQVSKSIEAQTDDMRLVHQRARLYMRLGRYDEAGRDFIRANELLAPPWGWEHGSGIFDSLMQHEEVFARVAELRPEDLALWAARGHYYAVRGQWERARADYARADEGPQPFVPHACALLLTGDEEGYRRECQRIVRRCGKTVYPGRAPHLVWACAAGPRSGIDPAQIVEWADLSLRSGRNSFTLQALAWAHYRAGQFDQTVRALHEAMEMPKAMPKSQAAFPLALAYCGLGHRDEARKWYEIGVAELERATPRTPDDPAPWSPLHWLDVNVWYREAKAVFEPTEPQEPKTEEPE